MEHVVFWSGHSGTREFARASHLPEAVELVERLRNSEGITDATVHSLTDVPVAFRTYYVAEVGTSGPSVPEPAPAVADPADLDDAADPEDAAATDKATVQADVEDVPAVEPAGPPALSVVPDMMDAPEPLPATDSPDEAASAEAASAEAPARSLGLFA